MISKNHQAIIELPASKSIGARFLVATYFAGTLPADPYFDDNDDLMVLQQALLNLYSDEQPIDYGETPIDVHASGTAFRFLTAVCASTPGADFVITGTPRLCERPMQPLIEVLRNAGAIIEPQGKESLGPYRVAGKHLEGGEFSIRGDISSQFISALMLSAPSWIHGMKLNFTTHLVSRPYLEMTAKLMAKFGVAVKLSDDYVEVNTGKYIEPEDFKVESDWSAASFFYEACAIAEKTIFINGLIPPPESLQGDAAVSSLFERLGVKSEFTETGVSINYEPSSANNQINLDFSDNPDIVLPYSLTCLCNDRNFRFTGIRTLRHKECDRIEALVKESAKLGYEITAGDDHIEWTGKRLPLHDNIVIETYDDHRVAMSFAIAALKMSEVRIINPDCVNKSFVRFWEQLPKLGLICELHEDVMSVRKI